MRELRTGDAASSESSSSSYFFSFKSLLRGWDHPTEAAAAVARDSNEIPNSLEGTTVDLP